MSEILFLNDNNMFYNTNYDILYYTYKCIYMSIYLFYDVVYKINGSLISTITIIVHYRIQKTTDDTI